MGPKKPGSAKKKSAKAAAAGSTGNEAENADKLAKAGTEIVVLTKTLEQTTNLTSRLRSKNSEQKALIDQLNHELDMKVRDRLDITSDMERQYKMMQHELTGKINNMEAQVADLKQKLAATQQGAADAAKEYERFIQEKDDLIEEQNLKMSYMSGEFESMLNETLAKMSRKLEAVSQRWKENDTIHFSDANSRRLADFHLKRLTTRDT